MEIKINENSVFTFNLEEVSIGIHRHPDGKYQGTPIFEGSIIFGNLDLLNKFREMIEILNEEDKLRNFIETTCLNCDHKTMDCEQNVINCFDKTVEVFMSKTHAKQLLVELEKYITDDSPYWNEYKQKIISTYGLK